VFEPHRVYLGLGANLGDRKRNLRQALRKMRAKATIEKVSDCYATKPIGYLEQPDFFNIACLITTALSPHELLRFLKQIETAMGRNPSFRNAPRPIDLDILFYDDLVLPSPELTIPHPRLNERAFVLVPLAEIAADLVHPSLHLTVDELRRRVGCEGVALVEKNRNKQTSLQEWLEE
jgi:2-amino-4-hydroxy-6-hydroxymethyldihydropteridine diphosphokinase